METPRQKGKKGTARVPSKMFFHVRFRKGRLRGMVAWNTSRAQGLGNLGSQAGKSISGAIWRRSNVGAYIIINVTPRSV